MRRILLALLLLVATTPLFASDSLVGTWKLNPAKTKYTAGTPPKELTIVVEEQGADLKVTATGTMGDGSPISIKYTIPVKGGAGSVQEAWYNGVTSTVISPKVRENKFTMDGKVVRTRRSTVSSDGKSAKISMKGTDAKGTMYEGVDFVDKKM